MARPRRLLLLGGTAEASQLAARLAGVDGLDVTTSLAGRTARPTPPPAGGLRVGGFGGSEGLRRYLEQKRVDVVVDATHPFAKVMRYHVFDACQAAGVPRLRLERDGWAPGAGDSWHEVGSLSEAAEELVALGAERVFVTTGRRELAPFVPAADGARWWLVRSIDPPDPQPLQPAEVVLARGPFTLAGELELMTRHRVDVVVTKNSGGDPSKLEAARTLGLPVVMVARPPSPPGPTAVTVDQALAWVRHVLADVG